MAKSNLDDSTADAVVAVVIVSVVVLSVVEWLSGFPLKRQQGSPLLRR